jgi:hypothetical protein
MRRARNHNHPFVLIGPQQSGKNVFLHLVARGFRAKDRTTLKDENVIQDDQSAALKYFFGPGGIVDQNRDALIHFDFMERALGWSTFIEKFHKIAIERVLERTDGKRIRCPKVRIVFGANYEIEPMLPAAPALIRYVYGALSSFQHATTRRLEEQPERLPTIIGEMIAAVVLQNEATEDQAKVAARIPEITLARLRGYSLPGEFNELFGVVRSALHSGNWEQAFPKAALGTVFVAWSKHSKTGATWLAKMLHRNGIVVEMAPDVVTFGKWLPQIVSRLREVDLVIFTFCKRDFEPGSSSVQFIEFWNAIDIEKARANELVIPVLVDDTRLEDLRKTPGVRPELIEELTVRQYYRIKPGERKNFRRLFEKLAERFRILRRGPGN